MTLVAPQHQVRPEVLAVMEEVIRLRRDLHRHPELGFQEFRTSGIVADYLEALGLTVRKGVAKTGVVAVIEGAEPGPTLLLRADMDGLPVHEATGLEYASTIKGKMHACGHDGHTSILLGTAKVLCGMKSRLKGNVKLVFQPAEEGPGGAEPMIREGVMENPRVDAACGLHLWSDIPVGEVGVQAGPFMAASDTFDVIVRGRGGHAAAPHQTIDSVLVASHLVVGLQSVVSRSVDPLDSVVVTVTRLHGGEAYNVIPDEVTLGGTIRTFRPELRSEVRDRVKALVEGVAAGFGATAEFRYEEGYPPVINDAHMAALVKFCCQDLLGAEAHVPDSRSLGGEDMAYFLNAVPGCYFFLGARDEAKGCDFPHHHPRFNVSEDAFPLGVELFVRVVERFFDTAAAREV